MLLTNCTKKNSSLTHILQIAVTVKTWFNLYNYYTFTLNVNLSQQHMYFLHFL